MGNKVHHVQPRYALLVQVVHGVRVFLAKNGHQHIRASNFLLAVAGGLHVHDGALNHPLKAQGGLGIDLFGTANLRGVVFDEIGQRSTQIVQIGGAGPQHFGGAGVVQERQQQVLDGNKFVALLSGFYEGHVQAYFQFLCNHFAYSFALADGINALKDLMGKTHIRAAKFHSTGSLTACSGWPACWAAMSTCSTLVLATSREYTPQMPRPSR